MRWVTRQDVRVGRMACVWLIRRIVDPTAEIHCLPAEQVMEVAARDGAIPFHVPNAEFTHRDGKTPFEAILSAHSLDQQPALAMLGRIVNGADTDNTLYNQPEGPGVRAVAEGIRALHPGDDEVMLLEGERLFDALYAYCRARTEA